MEGQHNPRSRPAEEARPAPGEVPPAERAGPITSSPSATLPNRPEAEHPWRERLLLSARTTASWVRSGGPPGHPWRNWLVLVVVLLAVGVARAFLVPWVATALNTVSTDDAYVNSHVTFVAPRVPGQVTEVLVDDNYRVKQGDVLVRLDKVPYEVQVAIKKAAVATAEADLVAANAQVHATVATARANRYKLQHTIEDVNTQIANLKAAVATLKSRKATLELAQGNLKRGEALAPAGISKEELDQRRQTVKVDEAAVDQALQQVYAIRVGLGLPAQPENGDLTEVPPDLDQTFSTVLQALATVIQSAAQFGYFATTWSATPKELLATFYKQDPEGNLDRILERLIPKAPAIKQAEAKLLQAKSDLDQALLNLKYTDVVAEIDGVVTSRNVNPGNNVTAGQSLMAVRSLTEIWVDANFKETQLADLRIGQQVRLEVDMYGSRREFKGYISGFTMGTGQTLALLPPQNATGNFVKIVQRLPVRIDLLNYDPDDVTLFAGLSVEPYVYYKKPLVDKDIPGKGKMLQHLTKLPTGPTLPRP
jgi:membrane fusion protein (multidrug efflux system)